MHAIPCAHDLTVSDVIDTVQVLLSILVEHVLARSPHQLKILCCELQN